MPVYDSTTGTGSGNAARLDLGDSNHLVDIHVDTSGDAQLTVEVASAAGSWRQADTVSYSGGSQELEQYEFAYNIARAYLSQNNNLVEMAGKDAN